MIVCWTNLKVKSPKRSGGLVPHQRLKTNSHRLLHLVSFALDLMGERGQACSSSPKPCAVQMLPKDDMLRQPKKTLPIGAEF